MFGLGFGMLLLYSALYDKLDPRNEYDIKEYVAKTAFYSAAFCVFIIAVQYLSNLSEISSGWDFSLNALSSIGNNLSTTVLMTMPFCFYLSRNKGVRGAAAFVVGVLSCLASVLSLSRGGLIFTSATCAFYVAFALYKYKDTRVRNAIALGAIFLLSLVVVLVWKKDFAKLFEEGIVPTSLKVKLALFGASFSTVLVTAYLYALFKTKDKKKLGVNLCALAGVAVLALVAVVVLWDKVKTLAVEADGYRGNMMIIAAENFKKFPIFGTGIGYRGLRGVYANKEGMFGCYHCLPVQVVGSMGLVGVAAYLFMLVVRVLALRRAPDQEYAAIVFFSYLGLLFMSLVNPGIFCPVVYGLQLAIYFISAERSEKIAPPPNK